MNKQEIEKELQDGMGKVITLEIESPLAERKFQGRLIGWSSWPKPATAPMGSYNDSTHLFEAFFEGGRSERFGVAETVRFRRERSKR